MQDPQYTCRRFTRTIRAVTCVAVLVGTPGIAAAQRGTFIDAAIAFRLSLAGTSGDEGRRLTAHLGEMAASLKVWDRALEMSVADLRSARADAPHDRAVAIHTRLASLFVERWRLDDALAELDAAITLDRSAPALVILRGLVHEAAGASREALEDFRRAWMLDPGDPIAAYLVLDRGRTEERDGPSPQLDALLDAMATARDRRISFIELALIRDSAADWPVFAPAAYAEGFRLFADGRYIEAVESFRRAASRDPLVVDPAARDARLALGIANVHASRFRAAIEHFEAVAAAVPGSSEARRLLAAAYAADGRHAEALPYLEAAVRLSPGDERARIALARALMRLERWTDAEAVLRNAIDAMPASGEARWLMADVYEQLERWTDAIQALEDATMLPMLAGRGPLYWRLGNSWLRQQDFEGVTRALAMHARLDPNDFVVRRELGLAYTRLADRDRALMELAMADLLGAEDPEVLAAIGQVHLESGHLALSEAPARRAIELDPNHVRGRYVLGTALLRLGRVREGAEHLAVLKRLREEERESQRRSYFAGTLMLQADRYAEEGRYERAAGVWMEMATLRPHDPGHRIALARALALGGDADGAVVVLELAAAMDGAPAEVHRELAALYAQLGRPEDSVRAQVTYERLRREPAAAPRSIR
jgi:tetratricopeptide (TPR) repeat protein